MMIITDTASDIFEDEAALMDVALVPLDIVFGDDHFVRNTPEEFEPVLHHAQASREDFPTTSQPAPDLYRALYEQAKQRGEEVLVITLSGGLSGTVESARIAAELSGWAEHVTSWTLATPSRRSGLLVEGGRALARRGAGSPRRSSSALGVVRDRIRICGVLDSLEYLRRGGRIPAAWPVVGDILSIKPVVAVRNGDLVSYGKARGQKGGQKLLRKEFERLERDVRWKVCFLYSQGRKLVDEFAEDFKARYGISEDDCRMVQIGPGHRHAPGAGLRGPRVRRHGQRRLIFRPPRWLEEGTGEPMAGSPVNERPLRGPARPRSRAGCMPSPERSKGAGHPDNERMPRRRYAPMSMTASANASPPEAQSDRLRARELLVRGAADAFARDAVQGGFARMRAPCLWRGRLKERGRRVCRGGVRQGIR